MRNTLLLLLALSSPTAARAEDVVAWNDIAMRAAVAAGLENSFGCVDPLHESRMIAMTQVAVHDALNAIVRRYEPYAFDGHAGAGASPEAAIAAAARGVLVATLPQLPADPLLGLTPAAGVQFVEEAYADALTAIPDGPSKSAGILVGEAAAAAIVRLRTGDGSDLAFLDFGYVPGQLPGDFQFIPGYPPFAAGTHWGEVTPFVLRSSSDYRPQPPYRLTSRKYAADFNEVKSLGAIDSVTRTQDQTEIALFWVEGSPQGWNRIARGVLMQQGAALWESARLFALLNLASADGYIADFTNKYRFEFWRPITAIRAAASDDNPATLADPAWDSLVPTPPAPDYPSGHSGQGAAMAEVLTRVLGKDVGFSTTSSTAPGVVRTFSSFAEAAQENADSRIYIGFHFRHATVEGLKLGGRIGQVAVNHFLRPVH